MQTQPSPRRHLHRLGIFILLGIIFFLIIKWAATPSSWNFQVWYRGDALQELATKEPVYGGNASCGGACHQDVIDFVQAEPHRNLQCEGCHGPLAKHVKEGEKIADAIIINDSSWQCLNCHQKLLGKPEDYPQFAQDPALRRIRKHKKLEEDPLCLRCHGPHDAYSDPERAERYSNASSSGG